MRERDTQRERERERERERDRDKETGRDTETDRHELVDTDCIQRKHGEKKVICEFLYSCKETAEIFIAVNVEKF